MQVTSKYHISVYITVIKFMLNNLVHRQLLLRFVPGLRGPFGTKKNLPFLPFWVQFFTQSHAAAVPGSSF